MTYIDIQPLRLTNKFEVTKFVKKHKIPLDKIGIADEVSGSLYLAEGSDLFAVHSRGEQITVYQGIQTFIGPLELASQGVLHTVYLNEDGELCTETGLKCTTEICTTPAWTSAIMDAIFLNK
jgi:hypothetical protein